MFKHIRGFLTAAAFAAVMSVGFGTAAKADAPMSIQGAKTVDSAAIIDLVQSKGDLVILDNRREADYNAGHIEGSVRLLDDDITGPDVLAKHVSSKTTPVLFYCNGLKCGRAAKAAEKAIGWGYGEVYYYALGMDEWKAKGLPLAVK